MQQYTNHQPAPCDAPIEQIYADDDLLVIAKPAGLLSVPGRFMKDCVLSRVLQTHPQARIVHRLDLDTSGLMVLGLSQRAVSGLNQQFRERRIHKTYHADVWGNLAASAGDIDWPIAPDPEHRPRQKIDPAGKPALTRYRLLQQWPGSARLLLTPVTGRSHQLRLHLAALGHPILGCDLYAHDEARQAAPRLMLHAVTLAFAHPASGADLQFEAPSNFPDDGLHL